MFACLLLIKPVNLNQRIYRQAYGHKNLYNAEFGFMQISKGITQNHEL